MGLAETIYLKGTCGTLALRPNGSIEPVHPPAWAPRWARHALARADRRTYIAHPRRHLVLLRDGRILWRARLAHGSDGVVLHRDSIAFTVYDRAQPDIWVARLGEAEHLAAQGEDLRGWARSGGLFTLHGNELRLRAPDGRLVRRLGLVTGTAYDSHTQTVVAITASHLLVRTDGRRTVSLADLGRLGLARHGWVGVLPSGLIKVGADERLLLLRPDGRRFASAAVASIVSSTLTLPGRRGVVFVTQRGRFDRVLMLERGHRVPRVLYSARSGPPQCAYWANLSLAGDNVLYWPSSGRALVAINALGRAAPRDLWPLVRRIPGFRHHGRLFRAAWASAWNG